MTDIVERLRSRAVFITATDMPSPVMREAADEIERLRDALREIESPPFEVLGYGSWEACEWMIECAANALGKDRA